MSDFDEEVEEAFAEISEETGVDFLLTNDPHTGIIARSAGAVRVLEAALDPTDEIVIASPIAQYDNPPDASLAEIVTIEAGPFAGKWLLVGVNGDVGHYYLTCKPSE